MLIVDETPGEGRSRTARTVKGGRRWLGRDEDGKGGGESLAGDMRDGALSIERGLICRACCSLWVSVERLFLVRKLKGVVVAVSTDAFVVLQCCGRWFVHTVLPGGVVQRGSRRGRQKGELAAVEPH